MLPVRLAPVTAPQTVSETGHGWQWVPAVGGASLGVAFVSFVISSVDLMMECVIPTVVLVVVMLDNSCIQLGLGPSI